MLLHATIILQQKRCLVENTRTYNLLLSTYFADSTVIHTTVHDDIVPC